MTLETFQPHAERRRAFTLIELMLVMALLIVTTTFLAPQLSEFFRGRSLDSEAKRFLALTRLAQSRAVAEGVPGFYLQIEVPASERAVIDQLGNRPKQIEVVAVREPTADNPLVVASVFVPATAETYFMEKVEAYRSRETAKGRPANEPLVSR
ncbi:MAG: prepilin-type N-terminal cleavage/methylation domain-containing protein, partial [Verrucomicrobiae bacterium]|nr:prepilin-type N-terminal cleavage/methylation domain-containing protein [Verrucomicrobiae bacterium]